MTNLPPSAVNLLRTALDRVQDLERALEEAREESADEHAFRYTDAIAHMRELRDITARLARLRLYADALESERARALEGERRWAAAIDWEQLSEARWADHYFREWQKTKTELARLRPVVEAAVRYAGLLNCSACLHPPEEETVLCNAVAELEAVTGLGSAGAPTREDGVPEAMSAEGNSRPLTQPDPTELAQLRRIDQVARRVFEEVDCQFANGIRAFGGSKGGAIIDPVLWSEFGEALFNAEAKISTSPAKPTMVGRQPAERGSEEE
jgi:hypothetical protein